MAAWQPVAQLSSEMLECAQRGDWQRLAGLETRRRPLIEKFFRQFTKLTPHDSEYVRHAVQQVLDLDRQLMDCCAHNQRDLEQQLHTLRRGRNASRAYAQSR
jgi:hypothetical protein